MTTAEKRIVAYTNLIVLLGHVASPWFLMAGLGIIHESYEPIPALGFYACLGIWLTLTAAGCACYVDGKGVTIEFSPKLDGKYLLSRGLVLTTSKFTAPYFTKPTFDDL